MAVLIEFNHPSLGKESVLIRDHDDKVEITPDWAGDVNRFEAIFTIAGDRLDPEYYPSRDAAIIGALRGLGTIGY